MLGTPRTLALLTVFTLSACTDQEPDRPDSGDPGLDAGADLGGADADPGDGATGDEGDSGGGESEDGGGSEDDGSDECEMGTVSASEVVMIGDSYLAASTVPRHLFEHARAGGSLGVSEAYREYHVGGTQMGNGQIPGQYTQAHAEDPAINTVIMTGGGNDVLIGDANGCLQAPPPAQACVDSLDVVFNAAAELLTQMGEDGVEHVVYFFYPHLPEGGIIQGAKNETLDYAYPMVKALCDGASPVECHFVDIREAFEGQDYIQFDGIHPNDAGSQVIADLVWETMVDNCIAQ